MSNFYSLLDEQFGDEDDLTDIRVVVRSCWFYDFVGYPVYLWQGKGRLFTSDGNSWLGTIDANGSDHHKVPAISDGRDGSSATYNFTLDLVDAPGQSRQQFYDAIKAEQWRANGRKVIRYLAAFREGEGLRPNTPIVFFKELTIMSTKFSEKIESSDGKLIKKYIPSIVCKDGNFGRSNIPNGTYGDSVQRQRALQLGAGVDLGCEYLALLANRTYTIP